MGNLEFGELSERFRERQIRIQNGRKNDYVLQALGAAVDPFTSLIDFGDPSYPYMLVRVGKPQSGVNVQCTFALN